MKNKTLYRKIAVNALISIVISLMVNFSYFVFMALAPSSSQGAAEPSRPQTVVESSSQTAQPHTPTEKIARRIVVDSLQNEVVIREENMGRLGRGQRHNPMAGRRGRLFVVVDTLYYFAVSLVLLCTMTFGVEKRRRDYALRLATALLMCVLFYLIAPQMTWSGRWVITAHAHPFNPMLLLKVSIVFAVAALYGKIYELLFRNQSMAVENEQLKNENLTSQYNMLVGQVNPHFLFNSLSSLSMLVREEKRDDALCYIDRMADTYRYIIQEGDRNLTTLDEELRFLESYKYLLEVRYEGKLFFDIVVDESCRNSLLPPLSIQPLVENAVKHNTITNAKPLTVRIFTADDYLVVSNTVCRKIEPETVGTGIGLKNLARRYRLLSGKEIVVEAGTKEFTVKLPITRPQ